MGFCPQLGGVGPCPAQCIWQGSGFAADQTNAMLAVGGTSCISLVSVAAADENSLSAAQAAYHSFPSLPPTKTRSLRCTAFFPPKPLRWVSAGALLGEVIKAPVLHFFGVPACGWYHYPPAAVAVSEQPRAGFISAEKTAFSEWVLCADGHAVPSCTQCFFGTSVWGGVVSLPSVCASCR